MDAETPNTSSSPSCTASISAKRVIWWLLGINVFCIAMIAALDAFINYAELSRYKVLQRLFNIAREDGIGTWFSVSQFLLASITLWLVFFREKLSATSRWKPACWALFALFFMYLSVDDASAVHERIGTLFEDIAYFQKKESGSSWIGSILKLFPSYPWQVVFGPFFLAMGMFLFVFLWREFGPSYLRTYLILGMSCYAVAIGLDFVEGMEGVHDSLRKAWEVDRYTVRHFSKAYEECMEMLGTTFLWVSFMGFLLSRQQKLTIHFEQGTPTDKQQS